MNSYEYLPDWAIIPDMTNKTPFIGHINVSKKSELCNMKPKTC